VLNKYGITGENPMDDGRRTGMQVTGKKNISVYPINKDG
jgi:hypothetical protein